MTTLDDIHKILDGMQDASDDADNDPDIHVLHVGVVPGLVAALRYAVSVANTKQRDDHILSILRGETE